MRESWRYSRGSLIQTEVTELDTKDQNSEMLDFDGDMIKLFRILG